MRSKSFQVIIQAVTHHLVVHRLCLDHRLGISFFLMVVVESRRGSWFKRL